MIFAIVEVLVTVDGARRAEDVADGRSALRLLNLVDPDKVHAHHQVHPNDTFLACQASREREALLRMDISVELHLKSGCAEKKDIVF